MAFVFSKIFWMFASPGNFLVLILLLSAFLAMSRQERWQTMGKRLCFDIALLMFFVAIFPVGDWMLRPLENRFPPAAPSHVDGIVIIGSDESPLLTEARHQPVLHSAASDYILVADLVHRYPDAKIVYAGGSNDLLSPNNKLSDADVAKQSLATIGVPVDRMIFEGKSRNTRENALYAADLVHPKPDENWLLVASAFHMPRSIGCFRKAGWNVYAAPSNFYTSGALSTDLHFDFIEHLAAMTTAAHEYYGLLSYWLLGYIDSPWPKA